MAHSTYLQCLLFLSLYRYLLYCLPDITGVNTLACTTPPFPVSHPIVPVPICCTRTHIQYFCTLGRVSSRSCWVSPGTRGQAEDTYLTFQQVHIDSLRYNTYSFCITDFLMTRHIWQSSRHLSVLKPLHLRWALMWMGVWSGRYAFTTRCYTREILIIFVIEDTDNLPGLTMQ
jgi:hypothetical protein